MRFWNKSDEARIQAPTRPETKGLKKKQKRLKGKNESPKKKLKVVESPKKKVKVGRKGRTTRCGHCGLTGHNASKCPNSGASVFRKPKKSASSQGEGLSQESQV
ncbi:unnamed protein product [Brassica rapa]|uniref:CCHC-type domain-containing protein n=1 Tax=Brassica campestris TaxID=3711 RepID=A0A8D9MC29_BRACM|nr:unnamed protein product [Brassica rapa]